MTKRIITILIYNWKSILLFLNIVSYLITVADIWVGYIFVCKYIINPDFQITKEEEEITIDMVCKYQPHLKDLFNEGTNLIKSVVVDWPNFQEIADQ